MLACTFPRKTYIGVSRRRKSYGMQKRASTYWRSLSAMVLALFIGASATSGLLSGAAKSSDCSSDQHAVVVGREGPETVSPCRCKLRLGLLGQSLSRGVQIAPEYPYGKEITSSIRASS